MEANVSIAVKYEIIYAIFIGIAISDLGSF